MKFIAIFLFISVVSEIKALSKILNRSVQDQIECGADELIFVEEIEIINSNETLKSICNYDLASKVKAICDGKNVCEIGANLESLIKECDQWMELNVIYQCIGYTEYLSKFAGNKTSVSLDYDLQFNNFNGSKLVRDKRNNKCPQRHFVNKHNCKSCSTNDELVDFAISADTYRRENNLQLITINTVFVGRTTYRQAGTDCIFNDSLPKYVCEFRHRRWMCADQYVRRRAKHNIRSGHFGGDF